MKILDISKIQEIQLKLMKKLHAFLIEKDIPYYLIAGSALGAVRHNGFIPWDDDIDIGMFREDYERFIQISKEFSSEYDVVNFKNANNCDYALTRIYIKNTYIDNSTILKTKLDKRLYFDIFPLDNVPNDDVELAKYEKRIRKMKLRLQKVDVRIYENSKIKLLVKNIISFTLKPFRKRILKTFDRLMKKYRYNDTFRICSLCSQYSFKKQVMLKTIYGTPTLYKFEDTELYAPENIHEYLSTLYGDDYMTVPPVEKRRKGYDIYILNEDE